MKQVEVTILGQGYILGCPEGGDTLLREAVATVDQEMGAIRDGGKVKARERIAVLAALNLAYRLAEAPVLAAAAAPAAKKTKSDPQADQIHALVQELDRVLSDDGQLI